MVTLVHEPLNPRDPNAIKVLTKSEQVGHVKGNITAVLAPVLDAGLVVVEGIVLPVALPSSDLVINYPEYSCHQL